MTARAARFICVFNGARDRYEVPLALEEAGLLEALVTDFYAPEDAPRWMPGALARRSRRGLPSARTIADGIAFAVQNTARLLRLDLLRVWPWIDARLARSAHRLAERRRAHLYCYHTYVPQELDADCCLIVFVFHPLAPQYLPLLEADAARFPEAQGSLEEERNWARHLPLPPDWKRADAIVCASSMTARTVLDAGAPPDRLAVIPYGAVAGQAIAPADWDEPRFLFVGQGVARKGLHHLIRAWQTRSRGRARLTIVANRIDPAIAALIRDPSIVLLGHQSADDLAALYAGHDVMVMPSLVEGFGLTYLEALAAGCHVVGTANSGLPDLAVTDEAVTLVAVGDLAALDAVLTGLAARKSSHGFDRAAIARDGTRRDWADFRRDIAAHAQRTLSAWQARREEG